MSKFLVAGLQLAVSQGNNLPEVEAAIEAAIQQTPDVDMIVLGELASHGSKPDAAEAAGGETELAYRRLAKKHKIWLVPGSHFERLDNFIYNTALAINPDGEVVARYRKMFPFVPYEAKTTAGSEFVVFDVPGLGRFGLCICYDIWYPEVIRTLTWMGAEFVICPTMTNTHDREVELCLARAAAATNQCYLLAVNVSGDLGVGQSIAVDPDGTVIHLAGTAPETFSLSLDSEVVAQCRERGVLGLCQTLKSFRDRPVEFPVYAADAGPGAYKQLGELYLPGKENEQAF